MKRFGLSQNLANVIMPTILLYYELLRLVDIDMLVVMPTTFTEGYTMYYVAQKTKHPYMEQLQALRLDMMRRMANKYLYDSIHSTRIESYCNVLFEALYKFIGLRYERSIYCRWLRFFMKRVNLSISANTTSVRITHRRDRYIRLGRRRKTDSGRRLVLRLRWDFAGIVARLSRADTRQKVNYPQN